MRWKERTCPLKDAVDPMLEDSTLPSSFHQLNQALARHHWHANCIVSH